MELNTKYIKDIREKSLGRNNKPLTIEELAYRLDLTPKTIILMENKPTFNPTIRTLYKVAEYFNVSLDNLVIN